MSKIECGVVNQKTTLNLWRHRRLLRSINPSTMSPVCPTVVASSYPTHGYWSVPSVLTSDFAVQYSLFQYSTIPVIALTTQQLHSLSLLALAVHSVTSHFHPDQTPDHPNEVSTVRFAVCVSLLSSPQLQVKMPFFAFAIVSVIGSTVPYLGTYVGFTSLGPAVGTIAAAAQAHIGATVVAGSAFAACQTAAMTTVAAVLP